MEDGQTPITRADLQNLERDLTAFIAETNEGLVYAMSALCMTLINTRTVAPEVLIAHLRLTTETMMRGHKSQLTQEAVDQTIFLIQQLAGQASPGDGAH